MLPREDAKLRILILRHGSFGDILMATPMLRAVRDAHPSAWITWIVESSSLDAVYANPYVDEILVWYGNDFRRRKGPLGRITRWSRMAWLRNELTRRSYDVFITYQAEEWLEVTGIMKSAKTIGVFDYVSLVPPDTLVRERAMSMLDYSLTALDKPLHKTDIFCSVLQLINAEQPETFQVDFGYTKEDEDVVNAFLASQGIEHLTNYVVVAPLSNWMTRNWPIENFAAVADQIANSTNLRIVIAGAERDHERLAEMIKKMHGIGTVASNLTFRQLGALIARADLLVGADSGPMHVAAAVLTDYVAIFGSTPIETLAPKQGRGACASHPVACRPCYRPNCANVDEPLVCLTSVTVEQVMGLCRRMLDKTN
jgi:heptosyltransferase I